MLESLREPRAKPASAKPAVKDCKIAMDISAMLGWLFQHFILDI
jgi:hypothetical protein